MTIDSVYKEILPIINEQFKMIGEKTRWQDIPEAGITVAKKKVPWYEFYKFKDQKQYEKWRAWALIELAKIGREFEIDQIDMIFGLNWKLEREVKEKGQLVLAF